MSNSTTGGGGGGSGDVVGPASSTDNAVARWDSTTGKLLQDSGIIVDDSDNMTGVNSLTLTTDLSVANGGTGASTLTGVLTGNGTSAVTANAVTQYGVVVGGASNAVASTAVGTATEVLTSNGAGVAPTFQAVSAGIGGSTGATDNAVLKADGTGGSTAQSEPDMLLTDAGKFQGPNGAASSPTYAFSGSTFSGMYLDGGGIGFAFNNSLRMLVGASFISANTTSSFSIRRLTGGPTQPIYSFQSDTNTGMYRVTTDTLGFTTAGVHSGGFDANGIFDTASGRVVNRTATGVTYSVLVTDYIVACTAGSITISFPATPTAGQIWIVTDEGGNAAGANITIDTTSTETINGAASISLTADYQSATIYSDGTNYFTID